jgi:hypothetical protein
MKIITIAIIIMLFSVVMSFKDPTIMIGDEQWISTYPKECCNYMWVGEQKFTIGETCTAKFGKIGTSRHLRVTQRPGTFQMDIYNGSTRNQFYTLKDNLVKNRWLFSEIKMGDEHTVNSFSVSFYLARLS